MGKGILTLVFKLNHLKGSTSDFQILSVWYFATFLGMALDPKLVLLALPFTALASLFDAPVAVEEFVSSLPKFNLEKRLLFSKSCCKS
jgi:hypothetical protein